MNYKTFAEQIKDLVTENNLHEAVARFITRHPMLLDPPGPEIQEEGRIYPSRQGWIAVSELLKQAEANDSEISRQQFSDLISREVGVMFFKMVEAEFKGIAVRW